MDINPIVNSIINLAPPVALLVVLNVIGYAIKQTPLPNWTIPFALPLIGAIVYPFIGEFSEFVKTARVPWMMMAVYGCGIGGAAVGANQALRQWLARKETPVDPKIPLTPPTVTP
jgi:hypothetical protein